MDIHIGFWIIFVIMVGVMLYIDLYVTDHEGHEKTLKSSAIWSLIWIGVALLFNSSLYFFYENGHEKAMEFLAGYLIEKSLSVDNLFVFIMIFQALNIKRINQPHILKWGILSAIVFRIIFIIAGVSLLHYFHATIYIFGAILLWASAKMLKDALSHQNETIDIENNLLVKFFKRRFHVVTNYNGNHFFTKETGRLALTPLFIALVMIESADIVFAVDSIPAVLAITTDPFIVITSNIMAILGLRALYFVLSGMLDLFRYLKHGVAFILFFVSIKMMITDFYKIPVSISLSVIFSVLVLSVVLSLIFKKEK
ncbi:MAG TPA: TerC/Alx family metal homeostasis membrane protein [Spirochaetota bacterium]|nr:TerC/Alx family metal homeostasis membrane protein [Spirochaetota bacterium]OQA97339.1 MAG: Inner membrane protein alx [Spirochaetes bacterium ADurb.Bin218]HON15930.1 TerC/Alx family metal homeostasis membrane protein [Spirochaetota bacterium]HOQ11697.1 TerC/Alx family metal homeostasis membrane protein [Spirochaetota bacterium]HOV08632.1 TerC/Alx family metal homeostasis membrane protein [Spirochaetota bacterium]